MIDKQEKDMTLEGVLKVVRALRIELDALDSFDEKFSRIVSFLRKIDRFDLQTFSNEEQYLIAQLIAIGQFDHLFGDFEGNEEDVHALLSFLMRTEEFYAPLGGLLGYYEHMLHLILASGDEQLPTLLPPPISDLRHSTEKMWHYCYAATYRLEEIAQVFTVGGVGDRLGLVDETTGEPLPVAMLLFCGRTLLESLFRDLQAQEYWRWCVSGDQVSVPVVLMTSEEHYNDRLISKMCEEHGWYGQKEVHRVVQPLIPLMTIEGDFACSKPLNIIGKPGGHGVIWKLMQDAGLFDLLEKKGVSSCLVRQINNPLSSVDTTLLSFLGAGLEENKRFGFAACPARSGFAEGLLAAVVDNKQTYTSNVEYTKFEAVRKKDPTLLEEGGKCPANTNILFARLSAVEEALLQMPIPGMVVNAKKSMDVLKNGEMISKRVVRLESTMQNITDVMRDPLSDDASLSTFVGLYDRSKVMSVTKRPFDDVHSLYETPVSCFYDWYKAAYQLLEQCEISLPQKMSFDHFIAEGPNLLFFYHPALGPFWEVIAQKLHEGRFAHGSEVELEIAELYARDLYVQGSFRMLCDDPLGRKGESPRAYLHNVTVENSGFVPTSLSEHVRRNVSRASSCTIQIQGNGELIAEDITISGDFSLKVPKNTRVRLSQGANNTIVVHEEPLDKPSWHYAVSWESGSQPILQKEP